MKKSKKGRKLNNQGMSLLEILVAIIILAIVTGPLLHAMVTSISLNTRAKERQRVITIAQSIMEGMKAYNIEQICAQFNGGSMRLVANAGEWREITDRNGDGIQDERFDASGDFVPSPDGVYEFALINIRYEGVNSDEFYDAKIEITPNTIWNPSGSLEMPDMVDMNEYLDAVYKQDSSNTDQTVYSKIVEKLLDELNEADQSEETYDLHDLEGMEGGLRVDKVTTVKVNEDADSGVSTVTVSVQYDYKATTGYIYIDAAGDEKDLEFEGTEYLEPTTIYDNTLTAALGKLENVFIYYYPAYGRYSPYSSDGIRHADIYSEKIVLESNTAGKNFYLIKQLNSAISHTQLMTYETQYNLTVSGSSSITLYHNLKENLAGSGSCTPTISGVTQGEAASGSMLAKTQEILLFDVKISLYEAGAAGYGFPEEMRLLDFNGSINN